VICGPLLLLAYVGTNIIWLSLMITPILCGLFLCVLNLPLFLLCHIFWSMSSHSLPAPSKPSSATMAVSSITPTLAHSPPPKGYFYGCLIHTLLRRMVKPSVSFAPSIICWCPGVALMPSPLSMPCVPPGFPPLAVRSYVRAVRPCPEQRLAIRPRAQAVRQPLEQRLVVRPPPQAVRPPGPSRLLRRLLH
jgi:hypothetical protein